MRALGFRLGDIPVTVDPTFWIIMGLFGLSRATARGSFDAVLVVEWVLLVFIGILVHELGHAVAFRAFGKPPSVVLYGMGGLTSAPGGLTPGRRLITTLAGPGVGFALGGLVLAVAAAGIWDPVGLQAYSLGYLLRLSISAPFVTDQLAQIVFLDLLFINIGWGLLNLIPLHPLDGGQSLEALLDLLRVGKAKLITSGVGVLVAGAGAWYALQIGSVFLVLIMVFLGFSNLRRLGVLGRSGPDAAPAGGGPTALSPQLQHTMGLAEQALQQGRPDEAVELLRQEHALRPTPQSARLLLAVLARTRRLDELEAVIASEGPRLDPATLNSAGAALVAGGRHEAGLRAAEAAWTADHSGSWMPAVTAATARAGLRDVDGAIRWLFMAIDRGWDDRRRLEGDPIFAEVRSDPRMGDLLQRMGV